MSREGQPISKFYYGSTLMSTVVVVSTLKATIEVDSWNLISYLIILSALPSYFIYLAISYHFVEKVVLITNDSLVSFIILVVVSTLAVLRDYIWKTFVIFFYWNYTMLINHQDMALKEPLEKKIIKKILRKSKVLPPKAK